VTSVGKIIAFSPGLTGLNLALSNKNKKKSCKKVLWNFEVLCDLYDTFN